MTPPYLKLNDKRGFDRVRKSGSLIQGVFLGLCLYKKTDGSKSRIGIIVSTKISKKAVIRNKIKRLIRAGLLKTSSLIPVGYDIVIMSKKNAVDADLNGIQADLEKSFKKHVG